MIHNRAFAERGLDAELPAAWATTPLLLARGRLHAAVGVAWLAVYLVLYLRVCRHRMARGDSTADAARQAELRVDVVAHKTTMESLVMAVSQALGAGQRRAQTV